MSYTPLSLSPVRVLLFKSNLVDALHVCLAMDMSPLWCEVQVLEGSPATVQSACASIRSGAMPPGLVLLDCDPAEARNVGILNLVREAPELRPAPLVVIGDGDDPESERLARRCGADGFIRRPTLARELARTGCDIANFWTSRQRKPA
jgi:CheY-like chemotaxis protein